MVDVSARVITGDCLQIMRELEAASIDGVLTDPPYCSGGFTETAKMQADNQGVRSELEEDWFAADNMTTGGLIFLLRACLVEARRLMRQNRSALIFTDWRMVPHVAPALESSGLRYRNMIAWDKMSAGLGTGFRAQHEMILEYSNGVTEYQRQDLGNVIECRRVPKAARVHPTQKPTELLRKLLTMIVPRGGTVLDPFAGSGAVGVAALLEGINYIGIEVDPMYAGITQRRLDQVRRPEMSFDELEPDLWAAEREAAGAA
jgi:DNA modification methylase